MLGLRPVFGIYHWGIPSTWIHQLKVFLLSPNYRLNQVQDSSRVTENHCPNWQCLGNTSQIAEHYSHLEANTQFVS